MKDQTIWYLGVPVEGFDWDVEIITSFDTEPDEDEEFWNEMEDMFPEHVQDSYVYSSDEFNDVWGCRATLI